MNDIMYFRTSDNEFIRLERFNGDIFKIFTDNYPESFSSCNYLEIKKQVNKGIWIEVDASKYNKYYNNN